MLIFTRIKKLNVDRSHLGTIRPMSQPIPPLPLYSLFTNISLSVSLEEGPLQTDLADFVKSLRLASAAPAPVAPSLGPRTRAGDRRWGSLTPH